MSLTQAILPFLFPYPNNPFVYVPPDMAVITNFPNILVLGNGSYFITYKIIVCPKQ